jgi:ribosomal protein S4
MTTNITKPLISKRTLTKFYKIPVKNHLRSILKNRRLKKKTTIYDVIKNYNNSKFKITPANLLMFYRSFIYIFKKKHKNLFYRYNTIILPWLRDFLVIFKIKRFKLKKRYARLRRLNSVNYLLTKHKRVFKSLLFIQHGIRFVFGKMKKRFLYNQVKNIKYKKKDKFLIFLNFLIFNLSNFLVFANLMPTNRYAKQFIRHGFVSVNGQLCKNVFQIIKPGDSIEIHKKSFIKSFFFNKKLWKFLNFRTGFDLPFIYCKYSSLIVFCLSVPNELEDVFSIFAYQYKNVNLRFLYFFFRYYLNG